MPIKVLASSDGGCASQSFDQPTLYLDHWAMRFFADDLLSQQRLVNALLKKQGTILVSQFFMVEFSRASDSRHATDAEVFIGHLLPHIYFTDFRLDATLERELKERDNIQRFWPTPDLLTLK